MQFVRMLPMAAEAIYPRSRWTETPPSMLSVCGFDGTHIVGNTTISAACREYFSPLYKANIRNMDTLIAEVEILSAISHTITQLMSEELKKPIE